MSRSDRSHDAIVVGGGAIGLSVAYRLACDGLSVALLERGKPGREASWAGAGILPPASWYSDHPALDRMAIEAAGLHADLSARLLEETGVDDQYVPCGAVYQETPQNAGYLRETFRRWADLGVEVLGQEATWTVPTEAQVRNPRRLRGLLAACQKRGVRVLPGEEVVDLVSSSPGSVDAVRTRTETFAAAHFCVAAGAWSPALAALAESPLSGKPMRGQMLLLRPTRQVLRKVVHRYPHYVVPRRDGLVLAGATLEDVGFDKRTTDAALVELLNVARAIEPSLADSEVIQHWSGLRPSTPDGLPVIGRAPDVANLWFATGHGRSGLQLSPPTAEMLGRMIVDEAFPPEARPFDPARLGPVRVS